MNEHIPFDDQIKKQLEDYSPDVPPHIWTQINAGKETKRPVLFYWFKQPVGKMFLGLILLLAATLVTRHFMAEKKSVATSVDPNLPAQSTFPAEKLLQQSNQETLNPVSPANDKQADEFQKDEKNAIQQSVLNSGIDKGLVATTDWVTTNNNKSNPDKTETSSSSLVNKKTKKQFRSKAASNHSIVPGWAEADFATGQNEREEKTTDETALSSMVTNADLLMNLRNFQPGLTDKKLLNLNIPCPGKKDNSSGNQQYLEFYAGPDYAFRSFSDTGTAAYAKSREQSTKFTFAYSAGMRYTKVFSNGMSFRTGLNYSQVNEKFSYANGNIIQTIYITDNNGDTTGSYMASSSRYKITYNKFRMLDIPLVVGYEMGNTRFHANINAGIIINVHSWQKGDVVDYDLNPVNINSSGKESPYQFKSNIGLGFLGSVSLYYKISDRMHILAEPYYRYNFTSASKAELTFKQKYNMAGLRLGLRFDF
jgi:opacity protein-like surface antigen